MLEKHRAGSDASRKSRMLARSILGGVLLAGALLFSTAGESRGCAIGADAMQVADNGHEARLQRECEDGDTASCRELAHVARDIAGALDILGRRCEAGDAETCSELAYLYDDPDPSLRDFTRAFALDSRACDLGRAESCRSVADRYVRGRGVARDVSQALDILGRVCDSGHAEACFEIGGLHWSGDRYDYASWDYFDRERALEFFQQACDMGLVSSCTFLGDIYSDVDARPFDLARAAAYYRLACAGHDAHGCRSLAQLQESGAGVKRETGEDQFPEYSVRTQKIRVRFPASEDRRPEGGEPDSAVDEQLGFYRTIDHSSRQLTRALLDRYLPAGEPDRALAATLADVLAEDARAHAAVLLRHQDTGGYLLIVTAPGAGETWRSGALTWPLLERAGRVLEDGVEFGVMYAHDSPGLPAFNAFYTLEAAP